ncbi:MAG TPA: xylose isomerase [Verrucomicrobiales bacterium]|nr:xylose isomerase [Verrucomicrobiales bacterium]
MNRRLFLQNAAAATAALGLSSLAAGCRSAGYGGRTALYRISLAEWSLNKSIRAGTMTNLDFPKVARREFDLDAVEYVNQFFMDKARDGAYLAELKRICSGEGVQSLLIMCDREGNLGDPDADKRKQAVLNHHKWADAAKFLGCHSIRVNAATGNTGSYEEQQKRAAEGLSELSGYCGKLGLNCIVENHGGLSSNGGWLAGVMRLVGRKNCGTLPDFGNFTIASGDRYDRYKGVEELMPFAKGVSAKSHDFDTAGNETSTDFRRMMEIVLAAGYKGYVGIEYEGSRLGEFEGIRATKDLLLRVRDELS